MNLFINNIDVEKDFCTKRYALNMCNVIEFHQKHSITTCLIARLPSSNYKFNYDNMLAGNEKLN